MHSQCSDVALMNMPTNIEHTHTYTGLRKLYTLETFVAKDASLFGKLLTNGSCLRDVKICQGFIHRRSP